MTSPILVAIAGGSGSGKSWLTRRLSIRLAGSASSLSLDDFYRDLSMFPLRQRALRNFDDPASIEWPLFLKTLIQIKSSSNQTIKTPRYDFKTHTRLPQCRQFARRQFVLVDGLWLLRFKRIRQLFDLTIYIDCDETLRFERRLARDLKMRGRSRKSVLRQFRQQVAPMNNRYVAPQMKYGHIVFSSDISEQDVSALAKRIRGLAANRVSVSCEPQETDNNRRQMAI